MVKFKRKNSSRKNDSSDPIEFRTNCGNINILPVIPEPYFVRHQIQGQIYRFYYRLAYDLELSEKISTLDKKSHPLPKGTSILLYNIIKYDMQSLVEGIKKCGLFNIHYDKNFHQVLNTLNGKREYALFSAFSE